MPLSVIFLRVTLTLRADPDKADIVEITPFGENLPEHGVIELVSHGWQ